MVTQAKWVGGYFWADLHTYLPLYLFIITHDYYGRFSLALAAAAAFAEGCTMRSLASLSQEVLRVSGPGKKDINTPAEASPSSFPKEQDLNPDVPTPELVSPWGEEWHSDLTTVWLGYAEAKDPSASGCLPELTFWPCIPTLQQAFLYRWRKWGRNELWTELVWDLLLWWWRQLLFLSRNKESLKLSIYCTFVQTP